MTDFSKTTMSLFLLKWGQIHSILGPEVKEIYKVLKFISNQFQGELYRQTTAILDEVKYFFS